MDIKRKIQQVVTDAVVAEFGAAVDEDTAAEASFVETPRESSHGDLATSAPLKLARPLRTKPLDIAERLSERVKADCEKRLPGFLKAVEIAPPGFINFRLGPAYFREMLGEAAAGGYGRRDIGRGISYDVEFVSANPTGPLTVAHGRQAAVGDALASILEFAGFEVTREYYVNDTGQQIRMLGASVFHYYAKAAGASYEMPEHGYRGDYIGDIGRLLLEREGRALLDLAEEEGVRKAGVFAADFILEGIKKDLVEFRVRFDVWTSQDEFETSGAVEDLTRRLGENGHSYESDGALWFRAGEFGDQKDRVLVKSDGAYTYRTPDMAYLESKFQRGFDRAVVLVGPDHHGHIITMEAGMRALGHPVEAFHGLIVQFCSLWRGEEKLKMSTRAGQFVTLSEVFEEVGIDATRYFFTARKTDSPLDFDLELAKQRSMDNPVYYIQYMSARLSGVLETAASDERFAPDLKDGLFLPKNTDLSPLGEEEEPLLAFLARLPDVIEKAALDLEQHRLCFYLHELASIFHNYYTRCRFVSDDTPLSRARLYLASALKVVLREQLGLIGVSAPDKM
ncbi:MAG: arginine--tRNA ligase [Planctomycetota bacterium]|jgi:arginyl-tRNA synthetase